MRPLRTATREENQAPTCAMFIGGGTAPSDTMADGGIAVVDGVL